MRTRSETKSGTPPPARGGLHYDSLTPAWRTDANCGSELIRSSPAHISTAASPPRIVSHHNAKLGQRQFLTSKLSALSVTPPPLKFFLFSVTGGASLQQRRNSRQYVFSNHDRVCVYRSMTFIRRSPTLHVVKST